MKRLLFAGLVTLILLANTAPALASCTTHTYFIDGRYIVCQTCCYVGQCSTTCL